jgi:hypothetical protein
MASLLWFYLPAMSSYIAKLLNDRRYWSKKIKIAAFTVATFIAMC